MDETPVFKTDVNAIILPGGTIGECVSGKGTGNFFLVRKGKYRWGVAVLGVEMKQTTWFFGEDGGWNFGGDGREAVVIAFDGILKWRVDLRTLVHRDSML